MLVNYSWPLAISQVSYHIFSKIELVGAIKMVTNRLKLEEEVHRIFCNFKYAFTKGLNN